MRRSGCLIALIAILVLPSLCWAQTVTVDLNKAKLAWDWTKGAPPNDGDPEGFTAKCGRVTGVYSSSTPVTDGAARSVNIRSIVNGTGIWFCVVGAQNRYGASGNSNEVFFDAGAVPAGPTNARVQAQ